tara:strand:+ start:471 stop:584 length:114 start_codon:yes stop_codon:yes gene_type:complete
VLQFGQAKFTNVELSLEDEDLGGGVGIGDGGETYGFC